MRLGFKWLDLRPRLLRLWKVPSPFRLSRRNVCPTHACDYCGDAEQTQQCDCGRIVCETHRDRFGRCPRCVAEDAYAAQAAAQDRADEAARYRHRCRGGY